MPQIPRIALPSIQSLMLALFANGRPLGTATGFVVTHNGQPHLITNWHVLAGRSPATGQPKHLSGAVPDEVSILHIMPQVGDTTNWEQRRENLLDGEGNPLWFEHILGRHIDVVALPLTNTAGVSLNPHSLDAPQVSPHLSVAESVSIVGFPFGRTGGGATAIWARGSIASEPELDFNHQPCFLVDARTRPGQSGSPAIFYSAGGPIHTGEGDLVMGLGNVVALLGIYSGRLIDSALVNLDDAASENSSDLGIVWRREVIRDILQHRHRRPALFGAQSASTASH